MTLFNTLENHRNETSTRRERFAVLLASIGGAVLVVTGVTIMMVYL
ncbi:MAG: hypothetical protein ACE141_18990 [Bryobacteraceae bacterium]